jgi:hypothetical protein
MKVVDVDNGREFLEYMKERQRKVDELAAVEQQIVEKTGGTDFEPRCASRPSSPRRPRSSRRRWPSWAPG